MEKLDAKTRPIGTLLSQEFFFRVPEYQRPFSWDTDHFEDLIQDIITANREQEYFLGTIVLHHREDAGHYDVVDGQQRLTSLMILLACLRDIVQASEYKNGIQDKILQKKNVVDGIPEKVRLEVKDRKLFLEMVVSEGRDDYRTRGERASRARMAIRPGGECVSRCAKQAQSRRDSRHHYISQSEVRCHLSGDNRV